MLLSGRVFCKVDKPAGSPTRSQIRQTGLIWAESFVFAGSSALLLLVARLSPDYWYLSLIALIPFLARIYWASPRDAIRLGFLFGFTFLFVSGLNGLPSAPLLSIAKILAGAALFAAFGGALGWTRQRWGFNPIIVALLWLGRA